jgi:hypothetical protein
MPIMLNTLLAQAGLSLSDTRLLRHQDNDAQKGRSPYELWRDDRSAFNTYQSIQKLSNRTKLGAKYWASFVGTPDKRTLFVGVYRVQYRGLLERDTPLVHMIGVDRARSRDVYDLAPDDGLADLAGSCSFPGE